MLVSTKGRYALRVLIDLAEHREQQEYVPLGSMAARQEISEKYLEAVLKPLVHAQIIAGSRGKGGGYRMLIDPEKITLGSVLRLVEPSLGTVSCLRENAESCPRADSCRTLPLWKELDAMILSYLDSRTLAELIEPAACSE